MKQASKDPFQVAYEEQDQDLQQQESPIDDYDDDDDEIGGGGGTSSIAAAADDGFADFLNTALTNNTNKDDDYDDDITTTNINNNPPSSSGPTPSRNTGTAPGKNKDDDEDDDEEENLDMELAKLPSSGDPDKLTKMQTILSQFTEEQMSRYESFRRSGFQKSNMRRLLTSITGNPKISMPVTIVVSGIAKMFVGDLVETARAVMNERKETGPIRPCHIREAYRRLKLEGKVPKKSLPRLFR